MPNFNPNPRQAQNLDLKNKIGLGMEAKKGESVRLWRELKNIRVKDNTLIKRKAIALKNQNSMGSNQVVGIGVHKGEDEDNLIICQNGYLKKWNGTDFSNLTNINYDTQKDVVFKNIKSKDSSSLLYQGQCSPTSTNRIIEDPNLIFGQKFAAKDFSSVVGIDVKTMLKWSLATATDERDGSVWVAWKTVPSGQSTNGAGKIAKYSSSGALLVSPKGFSSEVKDHISLGINSSGKVWVAWRGREDNMSSDHIYIRGISTNGILDAEKAENINNTLGGYDIVVDNNDEVHIAYKDGTTVLIKKYSSDFSNVLLSNSDIMSDYYTDYRLNYDGMNRIWLVARHGGDDSLLAIQYDLSLGKIGSNLNITSKKINQYDIDTDSKGNLHVIYIDKDTREVFLLKFSTGGSLILSMKITEKLAELWKGADITVDNNDEVFCIFKGSEGDLLLVKFDKNGKRLFSSEIKIADGDCPSTTMSNNELAICYIYNDTGYIVKYRNLDEDDYIGKVVEIYEGTGEGQMRMITGNEKGKIYLEGYLDTDPDETSKFRIYRSKKYLFLSNGQENVHKTDAALSFALNKLPKTQKIEAHIGHLFFASDDLLQWSERNLGEQVSINNWLKVEPDGDVITQIKTFRKTLIIYKKRSIYALYGDRPENFQLEKMADNIGCNCPKSVSNGNNMQFFMTKTDGKIQVFSINRLMSDTFNIALSEEIDEMLNDGMHTEDEIQNAVGKVYDNKYHIYIGNKRYVYDILESAKTGTNVWTYDTLQNEHQANCAVNFFDEHLIGSSQLGMVYKSDIKQANDQTTNLNQFPIYAEALTTDFEFSDQSFNKNIEQIRIFHEDSDNAKNLIVKASLDGGSFETLKTFITNQLDLKSNRVFLRKKCQTLALKFEGFDDFDNKFLGFRIDYFFENHA